MQNTTDSEAMVCAALVLDVVPIVMRTIRAHMREARAADLSVPQFRALAFLKSHPGTTLSDVAEYVGLTLPATSRMIDGLVSRQYAQRQPSSTNRRCIELRLSAQGREMLQVTMEHTQDALANLLASLAEEQLATTMQALEALRQVFSANPESRILPTERTENSSRP